MDPRVDPPYVADELPMLRSWLTWQRQTLAVKCDGLDAEQLRSRSVPPAKLSLLGLVRHMADVERNWFRRTYEQSDAPPLHYSAENEDGDFDDVDTADVDEAFATWQAEIAHADALVDARPDLDATGVRRGAEVSLRWILVHMIEEYARHNGHADLLRERIDGATGD
jgi:uncharacterized damage-inducible protein DinB